MSALPFAITQEAEAQIERLLLDAQKELKLLAMARVLAYSSSSSWSTPEGGGGFLGWHPFEEVIGSGEYTELELGGFRVFVHQSTLERLRGKRIVLDQGKDMGGGDILAVKDMAAS